MLEPRPSSKGVIVVTLAIVVGAFVGGSVYGEYRAGRTHALTAEIATNESPSIEHLAAARAELRDLQRLLSTHVLLASTGQAAPVQPLTEVRERLKMDLEVYFALPNLPGERQLWRRIEKELIDVDVLAGRILEETAAGRYPAAQRLLISELPAAIDEEADAIIAAIQLNAARVRHVAEEIEGERKSRLLWIFGLDGVSVALAIALAVLALRTVASREAVVRRRSEELEGFAGRVAHDLLNPIAAVEMSLAAAARSAGPPERVGGRARQSQPRRAPGFSSTISSRLPRRGRGRWRGRGPRRRGRRRRHRGAAPRPRSNAASPSTSTCRRGRSRSAARTGCWRACCRISCATPSSTWANVRGARCDVRVQVRGERLRFEVEDTGPGLPPALVSHAFDPVRPRRRYRRAGPGPGVGHGSPPGRGTRRPLRCSLRAGGGALFWFELPAAPEPAEPANDIHPPPAGPSQAAPGNARPPGVH